MDLYTVFDSNVYVAAALKPGGYADIWLDIAALPSSGLRLFVSEPILNEVHRKLVDRFRFPEAEVSLFISRLKRIAKVVKPIEKVDVVMDDPDDNVILECALAAKAKLIITADKHLLKLNPYRGIGIARPRELKNIFASQADNLRFDTALIPLSHGNN